MIKIIVTGSIPKEYERLIGEYIKKISPYDKLNIIKKKEIPLKKDGSNLDKKLQEETAIALREASGKIIVMDVLGKSYDTIQFKRLIEKSKNIGETISFIIGGSHGFDRDQIETLDRIKLSDLTMLHHMALLFLSEAIYRSYSIISGKTYHK